MTNNKIYIIFFILFGSYVNGQTIAENRNYFGNPLYLPTELAGTFGELRANHFHTGIDIKTCGVEGLPIYAVADGYIGRIGISSGGYGLVLYLNHPNGYTSVYAHLWKFNGKIAKYIKSRQIEQEAFEIDIPLDSSLLRFKKGEIIAFSGNSGGSTGPHLHYEIRETLTEKPVNPLLFGSDIYDNIEPIMQGIKLYPLTETSYLEVELPNGKIITVNYRQNYKFYCTKSSGGYVLKGIKKISGYGEIGLATRGVDFINGSSNKLGLYKIQLCVNDKAHFEKCMNKLDFSLKRFINNHCDFAEWKKTGEWYEKCFVQNNNVLPIYENYIDNGVIKLSSTEKTKITVYAIDIFSNSSSLPFTIYNVSKKNPIVSKVPDTYDTLLLYGQENIISKPDVYIKFPLGTFYDDVEFRYTEKPITEKIYSNIHVIDNTSIPINDYFEVAVKPITLPDHLKSKACLINNATGYIGGTWDKDMLKAKSRSLGSFYIVTDIDAPKLIPLNIKNNADLTGKAYITFKATDNLSGIATYKAYIDNKYVLLQRDAKAAQLYYEIDENCTKGTHTFKIVVSDNKSNVTSQTYSFIRR